MFGWRIVLWIGLVLGGLLFLFLVRGILLPFVLSFVIAALLEPTVRKLRLRGMSRGAAVASVTASFFLVAGLAIVLMAPPVTRQVATLTQRIEGLVDIVTRGDVNENFFRRWSPSVQMAEETPGPLDRLLAQNARTLERFGLPSTRDAIIEQYVEPQRPQIARLIKSAVDSLFGALTGLLRSVALLVVVPILVPLLLIDFDDIKRRGLRFVPPSLRAGAVSVLGDIGGVFFNYLRGMATLILLFIVAQAALMTLLGVPFGALLAVLFGLFYLIPMIGNFFSAITLFSLIGFGNVTGNWMFDMGNPWLYAGVVTLLFFVLAGGVFDQVITPRVVGHAVGLQPVVSMFVAFCGGALFGLPGMILAFPTAGAVKVILDRLLRVTSAPSDALDLPAVPLRHRET